MKKIVLFVLAGFLYLQTGICQLTLSLGNWPVGFTPTTADRSQGHCISGNSQQVVSAGLFNGQVDFDPGTGIFNMIAPVAPNPSDMYISRLTVGGNFLWVRQIGGIASGTETPRGIIDDGTFIYVVGSFNGTTDFNLIPFTPGGHTSAGSDDIFIAKYDAVTGAYVWSIRIGSAGLDQGYDICFDQSGNIVICGLFSGTIDFDPGPGKATLTSAGGTDAFFVKYTPAGVFITATMKRIGGTGDDNANTVTVNSSGNILVGGYFGSGDCDFDPGTPVVNVNPCSVYSGMRDGFLGQYTNLGVYVGKATFGTGDDDAIGDVVTDAANGIYFTGKVGADGTLAPSVSCPVGINLTNPGVNIFLGYGDIILVRMNSITAVAWARSCGSNQDDIGVGLSLDGTTPDHIYLTGYFERQAGDPQVDFDMVPTPPVADALNYAGGRDIFIARYRTDATLTEIDALGSIDMDRPRGLYLYPANQSLYITGTFRQTADFDPEGTISNLNAFGSPWVDNAFVSSYNYSSAPLRINPFFGNGNEDTGEISIDKQTDIEFYPNPTNGLVSIKMQDELMDSSITIEITDINGRLLLSENKIYDSGTNIDINKFESGLYIINIKGNNINHYQKIIKE